MLFINLLTYEPLFLYSVTSKVIAMTLNLASSDWVPIHLFPMDSRHSNISANSPIHQPWELLPTFQRNLDP